MILARTEFLGSDRGGRRTPPQSGFRPQIVAGDVHTSCVVENLSGEGSFEFNKEYNVALKLMFPELYEARFSVGDAVELYEGSKLIGCGAVTDIKK